jgi:hypothetical protein
MDRLIELNSRNLVLMACCVRFKVILQNFLNFQQEETSVRRKIIVSLQHCLINETLHHESSRGK